MSENQTTEPTGIKILVAEDIDSNYMLIKAFLKPHCIVRAVNGVDAVEKFRTEKFDIILMDIQMPIMNGFEATGIIRSTDSKIPIIAVTAYAFETDKERALEAGCNDVLTKPLKKSDLIQMILTMLDK